MIKERLLFFVQIFTINAYMEVWNFRNSAFPSVIPAENSKRMQTLYYSSFYCHSLSVVRKYTSTFGTRLPASHSNVNDMWNKFWTTLLARAFVCDASGQFLRFLLRTIFSTIIMNANSIVITWDRTFTF